MSNCSRSLLAVCLVGSTIVAMEFKPTPKDLKTNLFVKANSGESVLLQSTNEDVFRVDRTLVQHSNTLTNLLTDVKETKEEKVPVSIGSKNLSECISLLKLFNKAKPELVNALKAELEKMEHDPVIDLQTVLFECNEYLEIPLDTLFGYTPGCELLDCLPVMALQKAGVSCILQDEVDIHAFFISSCQNYLMAWSPSKGDLPRFTVWDLEQRSKIVCPGRFDGHVDFTEHGYQVVFDNYMDQATAIQLFLNNRCVTSFVRNERYESDFLAFSALNTLLRYDVTDIRTKQRSEIVIPSTIGLPSTVSFSTDGNVFGVITEPKFVVHPFLPIMRAWLGLFDKSGSQILISSIWQSGGNSFNDLKFIHGNQYLVGLNSSELRVWDLSAYTLAKKQRSKLMHLLPCLTFLQSYLLFKIEAAWKSNVQYVMPASLHSVYAEILTVVEKECDKETAALVDTILRKHVK